MDQLYDYLTKFIDDNPVLFGTLIVGLLGNASNASNASNTLITRIFSIIDIAFNFLYFIIVYTYQHIYKYIDVYFQYNTIVINISTTTRYVDMMSGDNERINVVIDKNALPIVKFIENNSKTQKFRTSEIQKFRNSEIQKLRNSETQKLRNSETQKFRNSETQKLRNLRNSEIQKLRNSETQKLRLICNHILLQFLCYFLLLF